MRISISFHHFVRVLCCLSVFFFFASSAGASSEGSTNGSVQSNTLFLPLNIITGEDSLHLSVQADKELDAAVAVSAQKYIGRDEAKTKVSYDSWPPSFQSLGIFAADSSIEYVVAGSITRFGSRLSVDIISYDLLDADGSRSFYKEAESVEELSLVLKDLVDKVLAHTGRLNRIYAIKITGNRRIDSGAILRNVRNRAGDYYNHAQLRNDLKSIFKMGYFNDVQISVEDGADGKSVIYHVIEKEVIGTVAITGEKDLKAEDIREVITVAPNTIVNPREIREAASNIRQFYKEKGYYDTEVTTKLTYPKKDYVDISFDIKEGVKVYIKEIAIDGNKAFSDKEIKKILATSSKGWLSWFTDSGLLKRDMLNEDASRIAAYYQNQGYIEAKVGEPEVEKTGEWLHVRFNIAEGVPYKVGLVEMGGDFVEEDAIVRKLTKIGDEKYFNRERLRDDVMRITDYYMSKGYAFAEVNPQVDKNIEEKRVDITFHINKGDLVHINRIVIKGNSRTRDKVIRRSLAVDEKSLYNATALKKSTERLQRLDFFEDINITPEPTSEDNLMDIIVELKEKSTGTFSIGAGFSSVDGLMFMSDVTQHNFLGRGQSLSLQASVGGSSTRYNLSFTEPHLNDSKLSFGFDIYNWERDYDDYDKESTGVSMRLGYPIWNRWRVYGGWGYDNSELTNVSDYASVIIRDSMDINTTHFLSLGVNRDTTNRRYNPSKGSNHSLSVKKAGGFLGGDSAFTKFEGSTSWYFPVIWDTVFHVRGAAGYVLEDETGKLPVYEKFYLGGLSTMRGFEYGEISPEDPETKEAIGGENMAYINIEYIFPLVKDVGLTGLVFYDTGFVHEEADDWDLQELRKSVGFGFRWLSPMGPLRLEWGLNIDPQDDEDSSLWDFSIGGQF